MADVGQIRATLVRARDRLAFPGGWVRDSYTVELGLDASGCSVDDLDDAVALTAVSAVFAMAPYGDAYRSLTDLACAALEVAAEEAGYESLLDVAQHADQPGAVRVYSHALLVLATSAGRLRVWKQYVAEQEQIRSWLSHLLGHPPAEDRASTV